jgi:hypothetical protein
MFLDINKHTNLMFTSSRRVQVAKGDSMVILRYLLQLLFLLIFDIRYLRIPI